ncbi:hypothetical protein V8E36_008160 [Tilletia maclaganii]
MPPRREDSGSTTREEAAAQLLLLADTIPGVLPIPPQQHESLPFYDSTQSMPAEHFSLPVPAAHLQPLPIPPSFFSLFEQQSRADSSKRVRKRKKANGTTSRAAPATPRQADDGLVPLEMHAVTSTADTLHAESHEELGAAMWNDFGLPYDDYPNDTSEDYARMLFSDGTAYVARIDLRTWIIEHVYKGMVQEGTFSHVTLYEGTSIAQEEEQLASCDCSEGRNGLSCKHTQVLLEHPARFKKEIILSWEMNPIAIQVAAHLHGRRAWFSVLSSRSTIAANSQDGKRCVVSLTKTELWTCSASHCTMDPQASSFCIHRQRASSFWNNTMMADSAGANGLEEVLEDEEVLTSAQENTTATNGSHIQVSPCSHRPISPPSFCRLPTDAQTARSVPLANLPAQLPLGAHARCDCGRESDPSQATFLRPCTVYYSNGATKTLIQTQQCDCGTDLAEYGLFNWNNSIIVAHEVFNVYTSQLCASPTPFTAFCTTTQHAYEEHGISNGIKFLTRPQFVKLYFAYISLQQLQVSFSCKICGPTPEVVIADGVVLAFSTSLRHADLSPPTTPGPDVNAQARSNSIIPFLPTAAVRTAAQQMADAIDSSTQEQVERLQAYQAALKVVKFASPILQLWSGQLESSLESAVRRALQHTIHQFSANEGVMQLCRPMCGGLLPTQSSKESYARLATTLARHCPFIGNVMVLFAHANPQAIKTATFKSLQSLLRTTSDVIDYQLKLLKPRATPAPASVAADSAKRYTETGSMYGAVKCRSRPTYPGLLEGKEGQNGEKQAIVEGSAEQQCRKYYDEYVKRQCTGGLMALWCTHCICVGFHVIPHAEGRNDVFSAVFTHWNSAPRVIVYDFACQLGPYSLRREADFFKDTLFVVDQMHEKGHTNCSAASRLSTYMRNDPTIQHLYSSAAECGNAGLGRIKKSVAYCNQEHAVALVRVFLSVWNRRRMQS